MAFAYAPRPGMMDRLARTSKPTKIRYFCRIARNDGLRSRPPRHRNTDFGANLATIRPATERSQQILEYQFDENTHNSYKENSSEKGLSDKP